MLTVLGIPLLEFLYLFGSLSVSFSSIEYDTPHSIHLPLLYTHTHTHTHTFTSHTPYPPHGSSIIALPFFF